MFMRFMHASTVAAFAICVSVFGTVHAQNQSLSNEVLTVQQVLREARDDQQVTVRGRLVRKIGDDDFVLAPATGETVGTYPFLSDAEIEAALARASRATLTWAAMACAERAVPMQAAAALLRAAKADLAQTITLEMGKPIAEAEAEIDKSVWNCEYVAGHAQAWLADEQERFAVTLQQVRKRRTGIPLHREIQRLGVRFAKGGGESSLGG